MSRARRTAAGAALLVVVLVAVLVGLLRTSGSGDVPGGSSAGSASGSPGRPATSTTGSRGGSAPTTGTLGRDPESGLPVVALTTLPRQAQQTVALIDAGGPFPYAQDGVTFGNREGRLPAHPRGWYREYTVRTPGEQDRGPRRIVTGDHDRQIFYTGDHYASFVRVTR